MQKLITTIAKNKEPILCFELADNRSPPDELLKILKNNTKDTVLDVSRYLHRSENRIKGETMSQTESEKMSAKSCLTDKPLKCRKDDRLRASDYARALCTFIRNADTPVTIGIQGGWGSGKTSLITVMQEQLSENPKDNPEVDPKHATLCVMVNAWEHSLFHSTDSKAEVALSLLNGLSLGVQKSAEAAARWLDPTVKDDINAQSEAISKAINGLKLGVRLATKVGLQMASNMIGGGDISPVLKDGESKVPDIPPQAENVRNLRRGLEETVKKITCQGNPITVVFFIDDLDRVPPPTAVEILDITKNIFDISHCVFVLAIDYEVVVKGLEDKFGKKTEENEREFRQYFDKIIQIPFSMPVGAYGDNLSTLLRQALVELGHDVTDDDNETIDRLAMDARLATGGIPRSIKRVMNTLSLLQHIANAKGKTRGGDEESLPKDLETHFIIVALHINFPEIASRIMSRPDFTNWTTDELNLPWKLKVEDNEADLEVLAKDQLFNDEWEKVVYCLCASSPWLKSQAPRVSQLMNNLLQSLEKGIKNPSKLSEGSIEKLKDILEDIKVVSIDSDTENQAIEVDNSSVKTDQVTVFCIKLQKALAEELPSIVPANADGYAKRYEGGRRNFSVDLEYEDNNVYFDVNWIKIKDKLEMGFYVWRHSMGVRESKPVVEENRGDFSSTSRGDWVWIGIKDGFAWDDFKTTDPASYVPKLVKAYKTADKIQKKLAKMAS